MTRLLSWSVLRTQLTGVLRRPGRLLMTGLSVLVASFIVFGAVMAYEIVTRTTEDTFSDTPAAVDLVASVPEGSDGFTAAQFDAVRALPGVADVAGRITADTMIHYGALRGSYIAVAADPGSGPLSRVRLTSGAYPTSANQIAVDTRTAQRLAVAPGATLPWIPASALADWTDEESLPEPVQVTVTGVVEAPSGFGEFGYAPQATVAAMAGDAAGFPRMDLTAEPGTDPSALSDALMTLLRDHDELSIQDGSTVREAELAEAVDTYTELFALVGMFIAIAVAAAALVATSTFRIVFAQRMRQLALLRTIGAHRGQLVRALAVEGALVGLVTGATGTLLALAAGHAAPAVAGATGNTLSSPGVPVGAALAVVLGAVVVTLGAVLAPAVSASGVAPLQALRTAGTVSGERRIGAGRLVFGLLLAFGAAGVGTLVWAMLGREDPDRDTLNTLLLLVLSGALAFCALMALGPLLIRPVLAAIGWPLRRLGPTGALAVSGVGGTPRRASAIAVVVALGVTLVTGAVVGSASLQGYVDEELAVRAPSDLALLSGAEPLAADVVERLRREPGLTNVTPYRSTSVQYRDTTAEAVDLNVTALSTSGDMRASSGTIAALRPGQAMVAGWIADELGLRAGDRTEFRSEQGGAVAVTVTAVLPMGAPMDGSIVLTPEDLTALGAPSDPSVVLVDAAADGDRALTAARETISGIVGTGDGIPGVEVAVLADLRTEAEDAVTSLLVAALGLLGLTVLIAVVGVGTTTGLSVLERTQESGLLRALGLSRSRLRQMVTTESALYGVIGAVLGLALGIPYAWLAVGALDLEAPFDLPVGQLLLILLALAAFTAVAGLLPARRAARVSPVAALGTPD